MYDKIEEIQITNLMIVLMDSIIIKQVPDDMQYMMFDAR